MTVRASLLNSGKVQKILRSLLLVLAFALVLNVFFVSLALFGAFKTLGSSQGTNWIISQGANPFAGLVLGILITAVVQSSSTTTSLVVGLVAAGALGDNTSEAVHLAIPLIMGANIGTSVTNSLVSFGHIGVKRDFQRAFAAATVHDFFNFLSVALLFPLQLATNFLGKISVATANLFEQLGGARFSSPLKLLVKPQQHLVADFLHQPVVASLVIALGLSYLLISALLFILRREQAGHKTAALRLGLAALSAIFVAALVHIPGLIQSPPLAMIMVALFGLFSSLLLLVKLMKSLVLKRIEGLFHHYIFKTTARAFVLGLLFTALVQSSSVTTSLIVPMAGAGLLTLEQVFPYTLGANIGTTITALLAALSLGQPAALAVALAHLYFNIFGIIAVYPIRRLPLFLARALASLSARWPPVAALFVALMFFILPLVGVLLAG